MKPELKRQLQPGLAFKVDRLSTGKQFEAQAQVDRWGNYYFQINGKLITPFEARVRYRVHWFDGLLREYIDPDMLREAVGRPSWLLKKLEKQNAFKGAYIPIPLEFCE